jgi:hypothetical protein
VAVLENLLIDHLVQRVENQRFFQKQPLNSGAVLDELQQLLATGPAQGVRAQIQENQFTVAFDGRQQTQNAIVVQTIVGKAQPSQVVRNLNHLKHSLEANPSHEVVSQV